MSSRRLALVLAAGAGTCLLAMIIVSVVTGATQDAHEWYRAPGAYAAGLLEHAAALRLTFGIDIAFIVLFTTFFIVFADYLRRLGRPFVGFALGALLVTAGLDLIEDHHIITMLDMAAQGRPIDDDHIVLQQLISQVKFSCSYIALVLFGLAIPRTTRLGTVLVAYLTVGTLITAVIGYGAPAAWRTQLDTIRALGFVIGFALTAEWLRRAPEPS